MTWELMKRDPAWRAVFWVTVDAAFLWPIVMFRADRDIARIVCGTLGSIALIAVFSLSAMQDRLTGFWAALPIRPREIFLARVLAIMALVWIPTAFGTAVVASGIWGKPGFTVTLALPAIAALASLVAIATQSALLRGSTLRRPIVLSLLMLPSVLPMMLLPFHVTRFIAPAALLCLCGALAIFLYTSGRIPDVLAAGIPETRSATTSAVTHRPSNRRPGLFFVLRRLYSWLDAVWLPVICMQAVTGPWINSTLFLFFGTSNSAFRAAWTQSLPLSRRRLLALNLIPLLCVVTAGYLVSARMGLGAHAEWSDIAETTTQGWPPSARQTSCGRINITPPIEFWKLARNETAGTILAPWGETFQPPVVRILGEDLYNPFAVGCTNTQHFFDWQFSRATEAVYGKSVSLNDYVHDRHPRPHPGPRLRILNVGALLLCALGVIALSLLPTWKAWRVQRWITWVVMGAVFIAYPLAMIFGATQIQNGIQWLSWRLPESLVLLMVFAFVPAILVYCFADKLVREGEFCLWPSSKQDQQTAARSQVRIW